MKAAATEITKIDRGVKKATEDITNIADLQVAAYVKQVFAFELSKNKLLNSGKLGYEGTLPNAIIQYQQTMHEFKGAQEKYSKELSAFKETVNSEHSKYKGKIPVMATEMARCSIDLDKAAKNIIKQLGEDAVVAENLNKKLQEISEAPEPTPAMLKSITMFYKLLEKRRSPKAQQQKEERENAQKHLTTFEEKFNASKDLLMSRSDMIQNTIPNKAVEILQSYSKSLTEIGQHFEQVADMISPRDDVATLASKAKIFRYELQPKEFQPIKLPESLQDLEIEPKKTISDPLPLGIARVVRPYDGKDDNQLSLVKGQSVYLLETPSQNWCLSMLPLSKKIGFAPRAAIAPVGRGAAYATEEYVVSGKNGTFTIKKGEIVATLRNEEQELLIETLTRNRGRVAADAFIIVA